MSESSLEAGQSVKSHNRNSGTYTATIISFCWRDFLVQNDPVQKNGEYLRKMDKKEEAVWESLLEGMGPTHLRHHSLGRLPHLPFHNKVDQKTKMMMASFFLCLQ